MKTSLLPTMALAGLCLAAASSAAQTPTPDSAELALQDLLNVEVVSAASKFPQEVREAPASVTIVTAEEIRRFGHRTLADVLRGVRGMYTTYDRNYSYVGLRGFSRPGDYNTRVLLLLDGHRLNDAVFDMAPLGTDFPIDLSLVDRVEVIRGPGSSLYGTNAFLAVINVISKTGAQRPGTRVDAAVGSLGTRSGSASYGQLLKNGTEFLLGASASGSAGATALRFEEFDAVASHLDDDETRGMFGSLSSGRFSIRGGAARRQKQIPTASFGTVFGDGREETTDRREYLDAMYDGPIGGGWLAMARLGYDHYRYAGHYPFADPVPYVSEDGADSHALTTDVNVRRRLARLHLFTVGTEVRTHLRNHQWATGEDGPILDVDRTGSAVGVYVQDEMRVTSWLLLSGGARIDRYPSFGTHTSPRAAVVLLPRRETSIKLLHGRAFRAPNPYELYYFNLMREQGWSVEPETSRSTEVVWEETISPRVRTSVSAFRHDAEHLIEQRALPESLSGDYLYFANGDTIRATGIEGELEVRLPAGLSAKYSQTYVRSSSHSTGVEYSNSPRVLSKTSVLIPVRAFTVGVEGQYVGRRLTLDGTALDGFFVPNVTLTSPAWRRFDLSLSVYNAFNTSYADPAAEEHAQRAIPQDGRTAMARLRVAF